MKSVYLLLASLLFVAVGVVWLILTPESANVAGLAHPDIAGMRVGGDTALASYRNIQIPALIIQTGTLIAMASLMFMAIPSARKDKAVIQMFASATLLSWIVWINISAFYLNSADGNTEDYLLGFPISSVWAVYGVWTAGLLFSAYYVFGFTKWVFSDNDQAKFDAIVAKYAAPENEGAS